jgi:probable F420-dependent oxidoreductase
VIALGLLPPYRQNVASDPAWMAAFARHADEVGFESLLTVEHVAVPVSYESRYPYSETGRMPLPADCELPDPLDLLAWLAAHTDRIRLGTGILVLPEHHPLQLAKRCATIDRLSGGRLFLGVGVGWMREEVAALGIDPDGRGGRTDEAIQALRAIWGDDTPSFTGRHFAFEPVYSRPQPVQATIPILVGGHSAAAAGRAGRLGDGFFPLGLAGEALDRRWAEVQAAARAAGREPVSVGLTLGGLLGDDAAITGAIDRGAERVVLSTRTADLDELRRAMDGAVSLVDRLSGP